MDSERSRKTPAPVALVARVSTTTTTAASAALVARVATAASVNEGQGFVTFHLDLAKFFLSCSDTVAWMFLSPLAPVILKRKPRTL